MKLAFTFQAKYLGVSPWESPGAFSILSYIEHAYGIYHLKGSAHPGSGLPIILESSRITANGFIQQDGIVMHEVKPLPDEKEYKLAKNSFGNVISI